MASTFLHFTYALQAKGTSHALVHSSLGALEMSRHEWFLVAYSLVIAFEASTQRIEQTSTWATEECGAAQRGERGVLTDSNKRLVVNCWGGLGNQMFEYAAGLYFAEKTGRGLEVVRPLLKNAHWNGYPRPFQLEEFTISHPVRMPKIADRFFLSTQPTLIALASKLGNALSARTIDEGAQYQFHPELLTELKQRTVYLNGFWQSARYVEQQQAALRQEYQFRTEPTGQNAENAKLIASLECAVSLHLRLGDYSGIVHTTAAGTVQNLVLRKEYYRAAIERVRQRFSAYTLVVFSDEPAAARTFLAEEPNCIYIQGNDASTAHEDLRHMSCCHHHIIANSSFSWWGAWLNASSDKQVFAPKFWGNTSESYYPDLYPEGWHVIDNLA